jgi:hypothetical protein
LALQAVAVAQTPTPQVFDFKGIQLGITLADMRATPIHDEYADGARVVCSNDPEVGVIDYLQVHATEAETRSGVQKCAYFTSTAETVGFTMGGRNYAAYDHAFYFFPDPQTGTPKLFEMRFYPRSDAAYDVVTALRDRWGAPATSTAIVPTVSGAHIEQQVYQWRRGGASLTVRTPDKAIDSMSIIYQLRDLAQLAHARVRAEERATPDRM